jgi:hypothetical protein
MQMLDASADAVIRRKDDGSLRRSLDLDSLDEVFWRIDLSANLIAFAIVASPVLYSFRHLYQQAGPIFDRASIGSIE